jgi:hypothetical protein
MKSRLRRPVPRTLEAKSNSTDKGLIPKMRSMNAIYKRLKRHAGKRNASRQKI